MVIGNMNNVDDIMDRDHIMDDGNGRLGLVVCEEILLSILKLKARLRT